MSEPQTIEFDGLTINVRDIVKDDDGPVNPQWVKIKFPIPETYEAPGKVAEWLISHCPCNWRTATYQNPTGRDSACVMVVWFENRDAALMFKLGSGHQAWEE